MASNIISANHEDFNSPRLTKTLDGKPAVLSTEIARHFNKRHDHILRDIANLITQLPEMFSQPNFGAANYIDQQGKKRQCYLLTRDAFSLLVMGLAGKQAIYWKLAYIRAFNRMEAEITNRDLRLSLDAAFQQGFDSGRASATDIVTKEVKEISRKVWKLGTKDKRLMRSVIRYREMGLGIQSIAKLLNIHGRTVSNLLSLASHLQFMQKAEASRND